MEYFDLTHRMNSRMPVYPGKEQPVFTPAATLEREGYREMHLRMDAHTGTHMDAPSHMMKSGRSLDSYPVSKFTGPAVVIPCSGKDGKIRVTDLLPFQEPICASGFILLHTGWGRLWGSAPYTTGFPVLSADAAHWLCTHPVKGIGVDALSVDPLESDAWEIHKILFGHDLIIVENLKFPDGLTQGTGIFFCFPLFFSNSDGSPVRAVFAR